MNNIRLLVVHDSRLLSDVMVNALEREPDFKVVSCATRIGQARDQLVMKPCDVLLMHVTVATPEMLGFIREIGRDHGTTRVVVLVWIDKAQTVLRCIQAGAAGYVLGRYSVSRLFQAIRLVHRNEALVSPEMAALLMSQVARMSSLVRRHAVFRPEGNGHAAGTWTDSPVDDPGLSARQWEVLELIGEGMSNSEIATHLGIGIGTVKHHVHVLLEKLPMSGRDMAAQWLRVHRSAARCDAVKEAA